jgi:hypothetical protein
MTTSELKHYILLYDATMNNPVYPVDLVYLRYSSRLLESFGSAICINTTWRVTLGEPFGFRGALKYYGVRVT